MIDGLNDLDKVIEICDVCLQAKHKQKFIRPKVKRATKPFELVHSDTCGPFSVLTKGGHLHYIIFVDDYTRWTTVYLLPDKKKETCIAAYQHYQAKVDARGYNIQRFRCDNGRGEYDNKLFRGLLATRGTALEFCPPESHHKNGVAERMIRTITERARAMILDSQAPLEFWGEAVNTAVYLHQRMPNEGLTRRDDRDGFKAPYDTPYEMQHSYGRPEFEKPLDDPTRKRINYKAPLHHLCRFGCYASRLIPEKQRTDQKLGARSKACMMVGYVHDSTTLWRIWDLEHKTVKAQSDVIFDEERNAYISCPQSLKRKQGVHDDEPKVTTEIDIFGLPQEGTYIEDIDASGTDESMAHGHTQDTSGMGESMSHGRADDAARWPVTGNPAALGANSDHPSPRHSTNGHGDRSPPASGVKNGHTHTHMAPDEDAHTHTDKGHSGHCPTLESQAPSRDEVITQRQLR
jgi:hypothetical protein